MRSEILPDGSAVPDSSRYENIYVAFHDGDPFILSRKVNISLAYLEDHFVNMVVAKKIQDVYGTRKPDSSFVTDIRDELHSRSIMKRDNSTGMYYTERIRGLDAFIQMMYDSESGKVYYVNSNFARGNDPKSNNSMRKNINAAVEEWIRERSKDDVGGIDFYFNSPVPYKDYEVHKMSEFIGVYNYLERTGMKNVSLTGDEKILLVNCSDGNMAKVARDSIGYDGQDFYCVNNSFVYVDDEGRHSVKVTPPFYFINSAEGSMVSIMDSLMKVIIDQSRENDMAYAAGDHHLMDEIGFEYMRNMMLLDIDIGRNIADITYDLIQDAISSEGNFLSDTDDEWLIRAIDSLGVSGNHVMENFVKVIFFVGSSFGISSNRNMYSNLYYYVGKRVPGSEPRYGDLFSVVFDMVDTIGGTDDEWQFDIMTSRYVVPPVVISEFGYESLCDQKIYNEKTRIATSSVYHVSAVSSGEIEEDVDYEEEVKVQAGNSIMNSINGKAAINKGGGQVLNNLDLFASVKMLSEYPLVYSETREMFAERGLEYEDIPVILMYDRANPGNLGGFYFHGTTGDPTLMSHGMLPPYITLNVFNRINRDDKRIINTLIHEASHFIDDILFRRGVITKEYMQSRELQEAQQERGRGGDQKKFWKSYLKLPTEFTAHMMEAYHDLKGMDPEVVAKNRDAIKMRLVKSLYMSSLANMIPISEDAHSGDRSLKLSPHDLEQNRHIVNLAVDVLEDGDVDDFLRTGQKHFDTVGIRSINEEGYELNLTEPLKHDALVSNGAKIGIGTTTDISVFGMRYELYDQITERAIDYYLYGGNVPRD